MIYVRRVSDLRNGIRLGNILRDERNREKNGVGNISEKEEDEGCKP
jgi:hypothetical protein